MRMVLLWSDLVAASPFGPAVFEVRPGHRRRVREWAAAHAVATAAQRDVHMPLVEAWAVLDGGVTAVSGYGLTSLPYGVRVIGFQALRLLLAHLDVPGPGPFPDEAPVPLDELHRRHRATRPGAAEAVEQAELLSVCRDAVLLRWVARTLSAETAARRDRSIGSTPPTAPDPTIARQPAGPQRATPTTADPSTATSDTTTSASTTSASTTSDAAALGTV